MEKLVSLRVRIHVKWAMATEWLLIVPTSQYFLPPSKLVEVVSSITRPTNLDDKKYR